MVAAYHSLVKLLAYVADVVWIRFTASRFWASLMLALCKHSILINLGQPLESHEVSLPGRTPRALGLLAVDFVEHCLQTPLERLVLGALVELADEMPADLERVVAEVESRPAEVLGSASAIWGQINLGR